MTSPVFSIASSNASSLSTQVADVAWPIGKHLPALKAAANIYSFAVEGTRDVYLCLILPPDTPEDVLEAVTDVLRSSSAFSTVKQVSSSSSSSFEQHWWLSVYIVVEVYQHVLTTL